MPDISKITTPNGTVYDLKDAAARSDLVNKITAPSAPSSGNILAYDGSSWIAEEPPEGTFMAIYDPATYSTTYAEIKAAYDAGKFCYAKYQAFTDPNPQYFPLVCEFGSSFVFQGINRDMQKIVSLQCSQSGWTNPILVYIAPLNSPNFTGTPTAPNPSQGANSSQIATTSFVQSVIAAVLSGGVVFRGETTTTLTDGATTNPITINGNSYTAVQGDLVISGNKEFVFDGTKWIELGDLSALGSLAWKDAAYGSYTPTGIVSQPTFTGSQFTSTGTFIPSGSIAISTGSGTANYTPTGTVSQPTFTGNEFTLTGFMSLGGTPISISQNSTKRYLEMSILNSRPAAPSSQAGAKYSGFDWAQITPSGIISTPEITVSKTTDTISPISSVGSLPSFTVTVENENLTLAFDAGVLPALGTSTSFLTDVSASASAPTFTGTDQYLLIEQYQSTSGPHNPHSGSYMGQNVLYYSGIEYLQEKDQLSAVVSNTIKSLSFTGTPSGTISQPIFTGTGVDLEAAFTGTSGSISVTGTPTGTVSQPTFTGASATITVS